MRRVRPESEDAGMNHLTSDFVYVVTLSTQPTEKDKIGCDGLYFMKITSYQPVPKKPEFMTYRGTSPGLVPSQKDIEAGLLRLEWSGPGEFHRFYGESLLDVTEKWNEFCKLHEVENV
jgi:hypothetical protein